MSEPNLLYYGDNLDVLRRHIKDASIDLVYLDPPFKSDVTYNVLFQDHGTKAAAQIEAFEDTWEWNTEAAAAYQNVVETGGEVATAMTAFRTLLGTSDMLAYLAMMAPRLVELHRVLKQTGSLYLHCDPTASHYLKLLLDAVFGPQQFRSEVIWKRSSAHSSSKRWSPVHDTLLLYAKTDASTWNPVHQPLPQSTIDAWYNNVETETGRHFNRADLTAAGVRSGASGTAWRGIDPTSKGRHWAIPRFVADVVGDLDTADALDALDAAGRIFWPKAAGGIPMLKRYVDEARGVPPLDVIADIGPLNNATAERLGYPTQKPLALLERILTVSSNPGDLVLDPFCGCGTTIDAAQALDRRWIGIDITHLAIGLIKHRLVDRYGPEIAKTYRVIGEPTTSEDAAVLAKEDPFQFQAWALGLVGARVASSDKKGGDGGVDGRLYFHDSNTGPTRQIVFSVKAGHLVPAYVRELEAVRQQQGADLGVLISFAPPTSGMLGEAAGFGFYESAWGKNQRIQLRTVGELLTGKGIDYPHVAGANITHKKATKAGAAPAETLELFAPGADLSE